MILQDIKQGDRLKGVIPNEIVQTVSIQPFGEDAIELVYRKNDGSLG
jgi:hypothetical protein